MWKKQRLIPAKSTLHNQKKVTKKAVPSEKFHCAQRDLWVWSCLKILRKECVFLFKVDISARHSQKLASSQCVSWCAQIVLLGPCLTTFARTLKSHLGMRNYTNEMELFTFLQREMPTYQNRIRFSKQFEIAREKNHCQPCKLHFPQSQSSCLQYFQNIFAS